jgi:hypothetical protein
MIYLDIPAALKLVLPETRSRVQTSQEPAMLP